MIKKISLVIAGLVLALILGSTAQAGEKVLICHRTSSSNNPILTLNVSVNALDAHLNHGDFLPHPLYGCEDVGPVPQ